MKDRLLRKGRPFAGFDESNRVELPGNTSPEANTGNDRQSSVCRNSINIWWAVDIEPAGPHNGTP
jgi:hypothetical protein